MNSQCPGCQTTGPAPVRRRRHQLRMRRRRRPGRHHRLLHGGCGGGCTITWVSRGGGVVTARARQAERVRRTPGIWSKRVPCAPRHRRVSCQSALPAAIHPHVTAGSAAAPNDRAPRSPVGAGRCDILARRPRPACAFHIQWPGRHYIAWLSTPGGGGIVSTCGGRRRGSARLTTCWTAPAPAG